MCHLCRKVKAPRGIDSKATKPILIALSKLHRHAVARLGDLWFWRHEETTKLRGLLGSLHKIVPAKALEAIKSEVDRDLIHIEKNMADHPPRKVTAGKDVFATRVTADQSSSMRMIREIQSEKERRERDRKAKGEASRGWELWESSAGQKLPDLAGSNIHPPSVSIKKSTRIVERWMRKNESLVAVESQEGLGNRSMVSVVGGGIRERPAIDVDIWKPSGIESRKDRLSGSRTVASQPNQIPITQLSNCIYDARSDHLHLDMRMFDQVAELAQKTVAKHQFQRSLSSALRKKAEKLITRQKISITEAVQLLLSKQKRRERKYLMSGGRSPGPSPKTPLVAFMNTSHGRASLESGMNDSISLTADEVGECIEMAGAEIKTNEHSSMTSSSLFSSRASPLNAGSLIQPLPSTRKRSFEREDRKCPVPPSSASSKDQPLRNAQRSKQSTLKEAARMETSPHKATAPVPIGRPPSPTAMNDIHQSVKDSQQISRKAVAPAAQRDGDSRRTACQEAKRAHPGTNAKSKDTLPAKGPYVEYAQSRNYDTSDAAQNASQGRTERRSSAADDRKGKICNALQMKQLSQGPGRSTPQIFAGSLDPEHIRPKEMKVVEAHRMASRRKAQTRYSTAIKKSQKSTDPTSSKHSDGVEGQRRGKIDPECLQSTEVEVKISDVVEKSRRRRAERDSVPFNDRYRNEERRKAWTSRTEESGRNG